MTDKTLFDVRAALRQCAESGKRVLVVGMGISGVETARFLSRTRIPAVGIERNDQEKFARTSKFIDAIQDLRSTGVEIHFGIDGEAASDILEGVGLAVLSPGVSLESAICGALRRRNIPFISELELGLELLQVPSVIVTGSNGKTTTVTLIHELLKAAGIRSHLCGNVGVPVVAELKAEHIFGGAERALDALVVEASSYQLESCRNIKPKVAILLNLSDNHLERHGTLQRYFEAKARLFANQDGSDFAVLNRDDPMVISLRGRVASQIATFGVTPASTTASEVAKAVIESEKTLRVSVRGAQEVYDVSSAALMGTHNRYNMTAAILAVRLMGAPQEKIAAALCRFPPLEHRLEFVERAGKPLYVNDSKSTTVAASVAALRAVLQHFPTRRVALMLGGLAKAGSWEPLMSLLSENQARLLPVICFGKDGNLLASHCRRYSLPHVQTSSLSSGLSAAVNECKSEDIVLLSPGCASFDEFTDFEHRGTVFKSLVSTL